MSLIGVKSKKLYSSYKKESTEPTYVNGEFRKGRRLQKTLIKSYFNRLLSVRKVTQDNQGKKTAGVDRVKSLNPKQRLELAKNLKLGNRAKPIRRVWIPKPGKDEKRPLGIPVMRDRAVQALAKAALEPEWEAKFEGNSYGFRPGRGAHDAIEAIFNQIRYKPNSNITKNINSPLSFNQPSDRNWSDVVDKHCRIVVCSEKEQYDKPHALAVLHGSDLKTTNHRGQLDYDGNLCGQTTKPVKPSPIWIADLEDYQVVTVFGATVEPRSKYLQKLQQKSEQYYQIFPFN